jgi:Septum formation
VARSSTIRLPGTDGPDIVVERGAFSKPRVRVDGKELPRTPGSKDTYTVVTADGATRSFALKSDRNGLRVIADDGSEFALDPPRPMWETVLAFLPIGLVAVGGLIGGGVGGAAAAGNIAISRSDLRTPVRIGAMLALSAAAVVAWLLISFAFANAIYRIPTYAAGECVNGIQADTGTNIDASAIRTTPCTGPHRGEVVGVHAIPATVGGATFPGMATIDALALEQCTSLFAGYVGIDYDSSRLELIYLHPSNETWGRGDRQIACVATGPAGGDLTGTVAGTAQ